MLQNPVTLPAPPLILSQLFLSIPTFLSHTYNGGGGGGNRDKYSATFRELGTKTMLGQSESNKARIIFFGEGAIFWQDRL